SEGKFLTGVAIDSLEWWQFARAQPAATIFHHPAWAKVLAECYGFRAFGLAVVDQAGQIQAGLPVLEVKRLLGAPRWISLPFTDHCAPLVAVGGSSADLVAGLVAVQRSYAIGRIEVRAPLDPDVSVRCHAPAVGHELRLESGDGAI